MEKTILNFKFSMIGIFFIEYVVFCNAVSDIFLNTHINQSLYILIKTFISVLILYSGFIFIKKIAIICKNSRWDLLFILIFSLVFGFAFYGFSYSLFHKLLTRISYFQLTVLLSIPLMILLSSKIREFQIKNSKKSRIDSAFIPDKEGETKADDHLQIRDQAENFAEMVYDNGSTESLVFGIDAPWGAGKSTFVNLCQEYWKDKHTDKVIIYSFDPLKYETKEKLLNVFITGLIKEIRDHVYAPEIEILVSKYANLLKDTKINLSFLGVNLVGMPIVSESIESVLKKLNPALLNIDKKIIVIIDDLDRLDFSIIKEVLFVIKKSFSLPNISYVVCYDTENLTTFENFRLNKDKVIEFLEKFINIKYSIYLDSKLLLEYFTENKDQSLTKNPTVNSELISKTVEGLKDIFYSNDFHLYIPFIGDARKIKRLINTIILLRVEKTDFDNCDFNKQDLIHLLLIYINYPNIFRKIYNTETQGKNGFFSATSEIIKTTPNNNGEKKQISFGGATYKNSDDYNQYLKTLKINQRFILDKVFNVSRLKDTHGDKQTISLRSFACFNQSKFRNLEMYLKLIVKTEYPDKTKQNKFYSNLVDKFQLNELSLGEIFSQEELRQEVNQALFWQTLVNTSYKKFSSEKFKEIINYALKILPQYSLLEKTNDFSFRITLSYYIAKFLDNMASNTNDNDIAAWILSDRPYKGKGIIDNFNKKDITCILDLLNFRLHCCVDRGGDISYLSSILSKNGNPKAPTEGITRDLVIEEMRELSQKTFQIFKEHYIDQKINVFDEIDKLTLKTLSGLDYEVVKLLPNIDRIVLTQKSSMKHFITYQLGSKLIQNGIGCGYYNVSGNVTYEENEEKHGIHHEFNEYLFNICFNPQLNKNNYEHFLDYLIILTATEFSFYGKDYIPTFNQITTVFNQTDLSSYWKKNKNDIKDLKREKDNKVIYTFNNVLSYNDCLNNIFLTLDQLEQSNDTKNETASLQANQNPPTSSHSDSPA